MPQTKSPAAGLFGRLRRPSHLRPRVPRFRPIPRALVARRHVKLGSIGGRFSQYQEALRVLVGFARIRSDCESLRIANRQPSWIGKIGPKAPRRGAEGPAKMRRRRFFFWVALCYRYKRDFHKGPRVTAHFPLLKRVGLVYYILHEFFYITLGPAK